AVNATPAEKVQTLIEDLEAALQELRELTAACEQKVPDEPVEVSEIERALNDSLTLAKQALNEKGGSAQPATGEQQADGSVAPVSSPAVLQTLDPTAQRNAIYEEIHRLADKLEKIETHSPVPWLLRKVTKLAAMRFDKLVEVLNGKDTVLEFLTPEEPEEKK
ncbi:MAG: hypothetical protein ACJ8LM_11060, partial [Candidatus Udaeobacter sp.]